MITHVRNGRLDPAPTDPVLARKRAMCLAGECARIEAQLKDATRRERVFASTPGGDEAYFDWRRRAEHALRMHNLELRLLNEWLEKQSVGMLRRACALFKTLQEEDVDFEPEELQLIGDLNRFVESAGNSVG